MSSTVKQTPSAIPDDADAPVEVLHAGRWLTLKKRGRWEYVERNNPGGAVIIMAMTPDDRILFVEQYRVSILQKTIEMPAGLVGDLDGGADEHLLVAPLDDVDAAAEIEPRAADDADLFTRRIRRRTEERPLAGQQARPRPHAAAPRRPCPHRHGQQDEQQNRAGEWERRIVAVAPERQRLSRRGRGVRRTRCGGGAHDDFESACAIYGFSGIGNWVMRTAKRSSTATSWPRATTRPSRYTSTG